MARWSLPKLARSFVSRARGGSITTFRTDTDSARRACPKGDLANIFFDHDGRLIHKWVHYLPVYQTQFAQFRNRPLRFLEIGVSQGGSLQMWRKYFGPDAVIYGVDVDPRCATVGDSDVQVRIGSQADPDFLRAVVEEMGGIDVVLDDGSHDARHQVVSFETLFPLLSDGGLYAVEDLHAAYWRPFHGGYRRKDSFIEVAKSLADGMHAWYYERKPPAIASDAKSTISAVMFFDSIVVIHKQSHSRPMHTTVGTPSF
jgi:hypothetical protein